MSSWNYDYLFKLLLVGESGVGKTTLLCSFTEGGFSGHLTTIGKKYLNLSIFYIGTDFKIKFLEIQNQKIKLQIWDTGGAERFRKIYEDYYKKVHGIILAYDISDRKSFINIKSWVKYIKNNSKGNNRIVLIACKCDKPDRVVTEEEGKKLAKELEIVFFEISSKTNKNVNKVFYYLGEDILENNFNYTKQKSNFHLNLHKFINY